MNLKKELLFIPSLFLSLFINTSIVVAAPDLIISDLVAQPDVEHGVPFTANITMVNQGDSDVSSPSNGSSVFYSVYLSLDSTLDTSDICAGTGGIFYQILTAGSTQSGDVTLQVNSENTPVGSYYLIAKTDAICSLGDNVAESDETNNSFTEEMILVNESSAVVDLSMTNLTGPIQVSRGVWLRLDTSITNFGTDTAPGRAASSCGHYTGIYLSSDANVTTNDLLLSRICLNSLAGGETKRWWHDVLIPTDIPMGFYYWGAIADYTDILKEVDETNNSFTSGNRVRVR